MRQRQTDLRQPFSFSASRCPIGEKSRLIPTAPQLSRRKHAITPACIIVILCYMGHLQTHSPDLQPAFTRRLFWPSPLSFSTANVLLPLLGSDACGCACCAVDADWRVWLLEANAEPDLMQTGDRLAPLIADLVDGIMELVVDPLAAAAAATAATATSAGATAASSDQFDLKKLNLASLAAAAADGQQQQKKKKQEGGSTADTTTTAAGASAASGGGSRATWVKVYEAAQRSAWGGASGVRMT